MDTISGPHTGKSQPDSLTLAPLLPTDLPAGSYVSTNPDLFAEGDLQGLLSLLPTKQDISEMAASIMSTFTKQVRDLKQQIDC